eukprot:3940476-Rhodomonas_salina.2
MPGTDMAHGARPLLPSYALTRLSCYARCRMCGTELGYGATQTMIHPPTILGRVATSMGVRYPPRARYAMPGTGILLSCSCATRCPVLAEYLPSRCGVLTSAMLVLSVWGYAGSVFLGRGTDVGDAGTSDKSSLNQELPEGMMSSIWYRPPSDTLCPVLDTQTACDVRYWLRLRYAMSGTDTGCLAYVAALVCVYTLSLRYVRD